jgi:hypothetical protein
MARIKVPEFKVGETITADEFNEAFDAFKPTNLVLDRDNFADESLGFDQIPVDISLTDLTKIIKSSDELVAKDMRGNTRAVQDPWRSPYSSYSGTRHPGVNHPQNNLITLKNLEAGDQFIIRASCVIDTTDGGWRTYMFGVPPIQKIGLVRFDNQTSEDFGFGSTSNPNTFPIKETLAHYRIVFTSKMPSSTALNRKVRYESDDSDVGTGSGEDPLQYVDTSNNPSATYLDTRLNPSTDAYGTPLNNPYMPFDGFHSYTTAFLYTHSASSSSTQSFGVMCSEIGGKVGYKPDGGSIPNEMTGGKYGSENPYHLPYTIRNFHLFAYQVKK